MPQWGKKSQGTTQGQANEGTSALVTLNTCQYLTVYCVFS